MGIGAEDGDCAAVLRTDWHEAHRSTKKKTDIHRFIYHTPVRYNFH